MIKKITLVIICILALSIPTFALEDINVQQGSVLSLNDCISIALNHNPAIKNARYNYGISKSNVGVARSEFFPTVGVGTGYSYNTTSSSKINTDTNAYTVQATLNQLLWNFGRTNANIKMQKFYLIADEYNFYNTVRETTFNVKQKYYEVLAARATVLINKAYVQINERNYQRTKAYFDEGIKSKIDLVNAEVTLSDSKIQLVQAENSYKNSLVNLNNAMYLVNAPAYSISGTEVFNNVNDNVAPVDLTKITKPSDKEISKLPVNVKDAKLTSSVETLELLTDYKVDEFPYSFEECMKMAYKNRADLKAYNSTLDAVKQNLLFVKRNYYPELSASAGYGFRNTNSTNSLNVGLNLSSSVNIMNQKYKVDAAKYQVDIAENSLNQLNQDIFFEVQNAYINMVELEKQIPLLAVKVRQTLENYELAEGRYYVGLGDYIQLQDAKVNYNNAQCSYIETIYKYNVARANLESVIAMPQQVTVTLEGK
ncbi:TPA: TolC family protein [Candidatus Gastranaerophilales bacterium HUM_6]|jgi:outer membrane protein|nr:TolC family protein [bacterium]CDE93268.1 type I secretion outer membrane protein [Fusobacterium sp. CAG:815]DAA93262.1 MAG TPA: TolC family protein [Candidatus Gastranaerophilales bacterium HUM_6]DAA93473.1 MAG TPA: TolC family protein [Candidatus Gastranaerophilales bacterium HUM_7]DAA99923.1 MAG TPA: TolC family protein [Candidatus Gastranaerophilales bacterium HUM_12]DAB08743.1 MAG TPA: TolC family protein [Candidatus Gastranaerophilales bacterium HUM_14]